MASLAEKTNPWTCPSCGVEVLAVQLYCTMCLRSRPMSKDGCPQIFAGLHIHFNGIIPRTLKHPSHSAEWRMAERHGAICDAVFIPAVTNVLVYRPGYERSDKVRLCLNRFLNIPCVPIAWVLDSLLQSRQIHPVLYRLQSIPAVALPTVRGPNLPHHQHPYFVMHAEECSLGQLPPRDGGFQRSAASGSSAAVATIDVGTVPDAIWEMCSPIQAVINGRGNDDEDEDDDAVGERGGKSSKGVELFTNMARQNRVDTKLFEGMHVVLSESLSTNADLIAAIEVCGGSVLSSIEAIATAATHVIYHTDDKKENLMVEACHIAATVRIGEITLATLTWLEDCLMLGEQVPALDVYGPSIKLRATLANKHRKKHGVTTTEA